MKLKTKTILTTTSTPLSRRTSTRSTWTLSGKSFSSQLREVNSNLCVKDVSQTYSLTANRNSETICLRSMAANVCSTISVNWSSKSHSSTIKSSVKSFTIVTQSQWTPKNPNIEASYKLYKPKSFWIQNHLQSVKNAKLSWALEGLRYTGNSTVILTRLQTNLPRRYCKRKNKLWLNRFVSNPLVLRELKAVKKKQKNLLEIIWADVTLN